MSKMSPKQLRLLIDVAYPTGARIFAIGPFMLAVQTREWITDPKPVQATAPRTPQIRR